jgi:hypothetical protein
MMPFAGAEASTQAFFAGRPVVQESFGEMVRGRQLWPRLSLFLIRPSTDLVSL